MYKEWISRQTHGIVKNDSYEAEPLEVKLRRATEEKKPIESVTTGRQKGGHIRIKVTEPCYIMCICSITPRIDSYRDWETDRKSTRLNSSHRSLSRMPSSA